MLEMKDDNAKHNHKNNNNDPKNEVKSRYNNPKK